MSGRERYSGPALLLPLQLEGLVLTDAAYNPAWSWTPPNFGFLDRFRPVEAQPFSASPPAIPGYRKFRGVVLHWALASGLTHGTARRDGGVDYPHTPNRWLVVRKSISPADPGAWCWGAWIVASDLTGAEPGSPFLDAQGRAIRLGQSWPLDQWPGEAWVAARALRPPLTALGTGDATYAAYTPNVPTVFAFPDPLTGVPEGPVTYAVFGWYAAPAVDPLLGAERFGPGGWQTREEWQELMRARGWSVGEEDDLEAAVGAGVAWAEARGIPVDPAVPREILPSRTLCHGLLFDVAWQGPSGPYTSGVPTSDPASAGYVRPQVALGASTTDALAALMAEAARARGWDEAKVSALEDILAAFQSDALPILDQADGQAQLDLRLQSQWFRATPGGTRYRLEAPDEARTPGQPPLPPLSDAQTALLTALNQSQAALDETAAELGAAQEALFLLWWKAGRLAAWLPPPPKHAEWETLLREATPRAEGEILAALTRWLALRQARDDAFGALSATLGERRLLSAPQGTYFQPNECVLMVTGAHRGFKHGEDARFSDDGTLFSRFTGQTIAGLEITRDGQKIRVGPAPFSLPSFPEPELPREVDDLVVEAFFLDTNDAPLIAQAAWPQDPWSVLGQVREEQTLLWNPAVNAPLDRRTIAERSGLLTQFNLGALPSKLGVVTWDPPWSPLFLDWKVTYYPAATDPRRALDSWSLSTRPQNDPRDDFTYRWTGAVPPPEAEGFTVQGRTLLTPQATDTLAARLEKLIAAYAADPALEHDLWALSSALDYLENADLLSQAMSGFNAALLELEPQVFLTPDPADPVARYLHPELGPAWIASASPRPDAAPRELNPIRAGHLRLEALWVVDGYGQVFDVLAAMGVDRQTLRPIRGTDLATEGSAQLVELKPRLTQPSRLELELLSARDDRRVVGLDAAADPISGWLIPNRLDQSLLVFEADGTPRGELFVAGSAARWFPDPTQGPPPHGGPPKVEIDDRHLAALIHGILDRADSKEALSALLALIDEVSFAVDPGGGWADQALPVLVGQPLAVVRASLALGLSGRPASSQRWDDTGRGVTGGFTAVSFPVQLGSTELLDDGLVGYYLDDDYRRIHSAYGLEPPHPFVAHEPPRVQPGGPPRLLTLLTLPGSKIHALSGAHPALALSLPGALAQPRLERMALLFRAGPVVGDQSSVALPLPALQRGRWSWVQYHGTADPAGASPVSAPGALAALPDAAPVAREGWLSLLLAGEDTRLTYSLSPAVVPITRDPESPSAVALELSAYNGTREPVELLRLRLDLPSGEGEEALTARPELVRPKVAAGPGFTVQNDGRGRLTLVPLEPPAPLIPPGFTLRLLLSGVQVNRRAGPVIVRLEETTDVTRQGAVQLMKANP